LAQILTYRFVEKILATSPFPEVCGKNWVKSLFVSVKSCRNWGSIKTFYNKKTSNILLKKANFRSKLLWPVPGVFPKKLIFAQNSWERSQEFLPKTLNFVPNSWDRFGPRSLFLINNQRKTPGTGPRSFFSVVPGVYPENHKTPGTDLVPGVWSQELYRHQLNQ